MYENSLLIAKWNNDSQLNILFAITAQFLN